MSAFLLLNPFSLAFDPSLAFLALGAVPSGIILYHFYRGDEVPMLGGKWSIPKPGKVDTKLLVGAALFGLGWGASGLCRMFRPSLSSDIISSKSFSSWAGCNQSWTSISDWQRTDTVAVVVVCFYFRGAFWRLDRTSVYKRKD